jgi:hypothetical protein
MVANNAHVFSKHIGFKASVKAELTELQPLTFQNPPSTTGDFAGPLKGLMKILGLLV